MKGTIIITGGTGLLGTSLVIQLVKNGYFVIITTRGLDKQELFLDKNQLENYRKNIIFLELDYLKDQSIQNFVKELERNSIKPTAIIHNARSLDTTKIEKDGRSLAENFLNEFKIGVVGPYELTYEITKSRIGVDFKNIIFISSIYGVVAPNPAIYDDFEQQSPIQYGVTKAAQIHLSKELSVRLAKKGIRVNTISLGGIKGRADSSFIERYSELTTQKRMLDLDDCIKPIVFLLEDGSSGMNGHNLIIDSGWTVW